MRAALALAVVAALALAALFWLGRREAPKESGPRAVAAPVAQPRLEAPAPAPQPPPDGGTQAEEPEPAPLAGETRTIELIQQPLSVYAGPVDDEAASVYGALLANLAPRGVRYDPHLGRAAHDLSFQQSFAGSTVPGEVLEFLLRSSGSVDRSVTEGYAATNERGLDVVKRRVEHLLEALPPQIGRGPVRIGVAETYVPGAPLPRFIAVLVSHREIEIAPAPRRVARGSTWTLTGTLPPGYAKPSALALYPNGEMRELEQLSVDGRRFTLLVPTGDARGTLQVSLSAEGSFGRTPLLQLPVEVDREIPASFVLRLPPPEDDLKSPAAAESRLVELVNDARTRERLAPLQRDPALDFVARAHSEEMRDQGFFGHRSPRTGDLADRLAAARYRAALSGENLALSPSVHEAHRGLLASLGHRRNLLSPASREDAVVALKAGHDVLVFPGGDLDACRPFYQPRGVHFGPRRGYIRIALQAGVPVVPVATIGSHYTMLMAPGGAWLARILGLKKLLRTERVPLPLHLWPPPVRITSEALPAMDVIAAAAGMEDEAARVERAHELVYGAIRDAVANMRPD